MKSLFLILCIMLFSGFIGFCLGSGSEQKNFFSSKNIIMIDLDGVLDDYSHYEENHIPAMKSGADLFLKHLYSKKYKLILFTTRDRSLAQKWLKQNKIDKYFFDITNIKYPAYIYIDDRAIQFQGDYQQTLKDVDNFRVYWK